MACCCFFGHHDCSESIRPLIREQIIKMYESDPDTEFLFGNQGKFDALVLSECKQLKREGIDLDFCVVLAYYPNENNTPVLPPEYTLYPEGIETVPKRFAISWRNRWLVNRADTVVCYIQHWYGGAAKFVELAAKKGKRIINLADTPMPF